MHTRMILTVPETASATLTLTMTIKEWKGFRDQLKHQDWPASRVADAIRDIIDQAEKLVWANPE